ncbi:hypothetical protein HK103_003190 [Boothiomyces macroporosus]|uniref:Uncharacterized protein n=1 Tax=Boothiomyces macroporosus TaxID=261099 RepID=A0AAD5U924_9FUNG|nr:hypothetical protein HK103_003190 [Boothiomyces macroporosus]
MSCCSCFGAEKVEEKPSKAVTQSSPVPVNMQVPTDISKAVEKAEEEVKVGQELVNQAQAEEQDQVVKVEKVETTQEVVKAEKVETTQEVVKAEKVETTQEAVKAEKIETTQAVETAIEPISDPVKVETTQEAVKVEKVETAIEPISDQVTNEAIPKEISADISKEAELIASAQSELQEIIDKVWESEQSHLFKNQQPHRALISPETAKFSSFEATAKPTNLPSTTEYYFRPTPPRYIVHAIIVSNLENKHSLLETILKNPLAKELAILDINKSVDFEEGGCIQLYNSIGANRYFATGSPLHFAAYMGDLESVKILKEHGALGEGSALGGSEQGVFTTAGEWSLSDCARASGNWQVDEFVNQ